MIWMAVGILIGVTMLAIILYREGKAEEKEVTKEELEEWELFCEQYNNRKNKKK